MVAAAHRRAKAEGKAQSVMEENEGKPASHASTSRARTQGPRLASELRVLIEIARFFSSRAEDCLGDFLRSLICT